jgi:hypothetical protein
MYMKMGLSHGRFAMGMLIFLLLLPGVVFSSGPVPAEWQKETRACFEKAHEYDRLARYLERRLKDIAAPDQPEAIIILSYAYRQLEDAVNEKKWVSRYFEAHRDRELDLSFLAPRERVRLFEYLHRWERRFPGVTAVRVNPSSWKIAYYSPPPSISLDIQAVAPSEITVLTDNGEALYKGYLKKGLNTIQLSIPPAFVRQTRHPLTLRLENQSVEVQKQVILSGRFQVPENVEFNPARGALSIREKQFKPEQTRTIVRETRRYFDKAYFRKKVLFHLGIGAGLFLVNRLAFYPGAHGDPGSSSNRALLSGLDKTSTVMAVGFSLKGILHIFKSFKKEYREKPLIIPHPGAAAYNRELEQQIQRARTRVSVSYRILRMESPKREEEK